MGGERHGKGWSRGFRLRCHSDAGDCHLADPSHFSLINQLGFIALTRRPLVWESRNLCCFGILPDGPMELFPPTSSFLLLPPRGHEIFENWTMALIFFGFESMAETISTVDGRRGVCGVAGLPPGPGGPSGGTGWDGVRWGGILGVTIGFRKGETKGGMSCQSR